MQKKHSNQITKFIFTISIIVLFFWWWNFAQISNTTTLLWWIDLIQDKWTDLEKFEEMVKHFCESISSISDRNYNSSQSLFVYYVCQKNQNPRFNKTKWFSKDPENSYINFIEDQEWNKINSLEQNLPWFYYNTESYIQTLFDLIIASYTSIYQANIYWYTNDPDKSIEDLINTNFAKKHFILNPDEKNFEYIEICTTDKAEYNYPKTCKKLKEYFYWARNLINSNTENYLNDQNIYKSAPKDNKGWINCNDQLDNIIPCGLYWGKTEYFTDLLYNELIFYAIFVDYYSYLLENKSDFKNLNVTDFQTKLANNQKRIQKITNALESSREAIRTTVKMLKEIQYSFPIHVWFLMYSEDIYKITSSMNKTLTPIYTLYDIFRNVQNPE